MTRNGIMNDLVRQALINAELNGMAYNGEHGAHNVPCTYWLLDDHVVTYLTDDEAFDATMLSDDMMDELIFEER